MVKIIQSILVGFRMSFIEMASHKLRSLLSILGVMLGVASLVAMLTLIAGIDVFLNEKMGRWAGSIWIREIRDPPDDQKISWSRSPSLRYSDGRYLEKFAKDVKHFYPAIERRGEIHVAGRKERGGLKGVDITSLENDLENMHLSKGRPFSDDDYKKGTRVCLISWELKERLQRQMTMNHFEDTTVISRDLLYKNVRMKIIGIFSPDDPDFKPWHLRRRVFVPITTMQKHITGYDPHPGYLWMAVKDAKNILTQAANISRVLKVRHRGVEDFEFRTAEWLEEIRTMLNNISLLMTVVSVIALLVGGLSIMNVMLSSISERIYEIGIRKALGAQTLQIFIQFITETVTLSITGGTFGVFLGMLPMAFREGIKQSTEGAVEPTVVVIHLIYVFCIIVGVGIVFGLYPAIKASRMNPIEALRYE